MTYQEPELLQMCFAQLTFLEVAKEEERLTILQRNGCINIAMWITAEHYLSNKELEWGYYRC
jgi:hypothetical protein